MINWVVSPARVTCHWPKIMTTTNRSSSNFMTFPVELVLPDPFHVKGVSHGLSLI